MYTSDFFFRCMYGADVVNHVSPIMNLNFIRLFICVYIFVGVMSPAFTSILEQLFGSCHICIFIILFFSYLCHKGLLSDVNCVIQILNIFVNHQKVTVLYALQLGNRLAYMSYIYTFSKPYKTIIC